jgi:hypothetical protein
MIDPVRRCALGVLGGAVLAQPGLAAAAPSAAARLGTQGPDTGTAGHGPRTSDAALALRLREEPAGEAGLGPPVAVLRVLPVVIARLVTPTTGAPVDRGYPLPLADGPHP